MCGILYLSDLLPLLYAFFYACLDNHTTIKNEIVNLGKKPKPIELWDNKETFLCGRELAYNRKLYKLIFN